MNIPKAQAFDWMSSESIDPEKAAELNQEAIAKANLEALEIAKKYYALFHTGVGAEVLQDLRNKTIEVSLFDINRSIVQAQMALSPADWAYIRGGQNSIVHHIEEQIAFAMQPPEIEPEKKEE